MTGPEFVSWRQSLSLAQLGAAGALGLNLRTVQRYEAGTLPIPLSVALAAKWLTAEKQLRALLAPSP